ncbi:MAG: hypothetical protein J7J71_06800 [Deltaproteobacteria bacterium]|nr:hypothetical protein [Candidatus Tharpella sp.]
MKKITEKQRHCLKHINWDYNISIESMFAVINDEQPRAGHWSKDDLLVRMLERLSWYDLLDFFSVEVMKEKLTHNFLLKIHNHEIRGKYERLGKILRGEPVQFTKWGAEYRAKCKDTLFSNRWYST